MSIEQDDRPKKRTRTEESQDEAVKSTRAGLFAPFRALGIITNHIPFALQTRSFKGATEGPRTHILTCLGSSWAMWEGGKMTLLFVGTYTTCYSGAAGLCLQVLKVSIRFHAWL